MYWNSSRRHDWTLPTKERAIWRSIKTRYFYILLSNLPKNWRWNRVSRLHTLSLFSCVYFFFRLHIIIIHEIREKEKNKRRRRVVFHGSQCSSAVADVGREGAVDSALDSPWIFSRVFFPSLCGEFILISSLSTAFSKDILVCHLPFYILTCGLYTKFLFHKKRPFVCVNILEEER